MLSVQVVLPKSEDQTPDYRLLRRKSINAEQIHEVYISCIPVNNLTQGFQVDFWHHDINTIALNTSTQSQGHQAKCI